jgi:hypothetical protein
MPKRADIIRFHSEEAAACSRAAANATGPAKQELRDLAADHQAHADMPRHSEYPTDLED